MQSDLMQSPGRGRGMQVIQRGKPDDDWRTPGTNPTWDAQSFGVGPGILTALYSPSSVIPRLTSGASLGAQQ